MLVGACWAFDRRPGDVLVVDAHGDLESSIMGDLMTRYAMSRGVAAVVIDGAVRDRDFISNGSLPIFARGFSHIGPDKVGPGEIHVPVTIGGVVVHDGDLVVGDSDGVTIVPHARIDEALANAERIVNNEVETRRAIDAGTWDRSWVDVACTVIMVPDAT